MADPFSNNPELDTDDPNYSPWRIPMALPRQGGRIPPLAPQPEPAGLAPKIGGITEDQPSQQASLQQFGNTNPTPPRSILGTDVAPGEQISDKQMPKAEKLSADPKAAANFLGQQDYHNQLSQYGSQRKMLDHMMPTDVTDSAFLPKLNAYRAERGALQEQEANFKKDHPWGSPESAHPGVMGKIGHVLGEIGNVAGQALAPGLTEAIPGSKLNLDAQAAQGAGQIKEAEGQQAAIQKAEAATTTAGAKDTDANVNRPRETSVKEGQLGVNDRLATTHENQLQNQLGEAVRNGDEDQAQKILDMIKQEKAAAKPVNQQHVLGTDATGKQVEGNYHPDTGTWTKDTGEAIPGFRQLPPQTPAGNLLVTPEGTITQAKSGGKFEPGTQTISGAASLGRPTTQQRNISAQADVALAGIPDTIAEIKALAPQLGPVAGRWNEFVQGKVGLDNPAFAGLQSDLVMLSSAVALAHARGRLPENLRQEFDHMMNAPQQTPENLVAVLEHVSTWMNRMSQMGGSNPFAPPTNTPGATPPANPLGNVPSFADWKKKAGGVQ